MFLSGSGEEIGALEYISPEECFSEMLHLDGDRILDAFSSRLLEGVTVDADDRSVRRVLSHGYG
jgi:hypothetical protein